MNIKEISVISLIILVLFIVTWRLKGVRMGEKNLTKKLKLEKSEGGTTLVTLYDNYQHVSQLRTGWGFSCLIGTENKTLLFDTGGDSQTLLGNMEKLGIAPGEVDLVFLSHIHEDHVGGLEGFLKENPNVTVYIPASFPNSLRDKIKEAGADFVGVGSPQEITDVMSSTGELRGPPKEQSLMISTDKGLVVITGCAHPGIVRIVEKAKNLTGKDIHLVIGGFHLSGASESRLMNIVSSFRKLGVQKVAPSHCSGDRTRQLFQEEYGDAYIGNGVGRVIKIK